MFSARERVTKAPEVERYSNLKYPYRLNLLDFKLRSTSSWTNKSRAYSYDRPPVDDITIEEFETCALDRLRVLAEIESSFVRNRTWDELKTVTQNQSEKYLPLSSRTAVTVDRDSERRKDHIGHYVLRLAFCRSWVAFCLDRDDRSVYNPTREDLRRRFVKAELALFRVRYDTDDKDELRDFIHSRDFDWIEVRVVQMYLE